MKEAMGLADFYRDRTLFVTGASGFMGKVLLEKLLYSCSDLTRIYILVRTKRGRSAESRVEDMFKLPMFGRIRKEKPHVMCKLVALQGDITVDDLGLSSENQVRLQEEVSVVFHCAATLRLEAKLKDAVEMNMYGTWRVLQLCKGMKNLKSFVHLSTAFCHCDQEELDEKVYSASVEPGDIMRCIRWMDDTTLDMITPRLIQPHPNTYTFSKRLAENLIADHFLTMPVAIARPAIVTPSWKEPLPGWVDNLNGPIGLLVGGGKGVIRSMHCRAEFHSEVMPVDFAINALVAIGAKVGRAEEKPAEIPVFNITASSVKRPTWGEVLEKGRRHMHANPFEMTIWYPDGNIRSNKFMHTMCVIFLHWLPAYFIDFMMLVFRQKRFMVRIQHRIQDGLEVLQYFTTREWTFNSSKLVALGQEMSAHDKKEFSLAFDELDEDQYLENCILGARHYCLKEDPASLPRCRRNLKILYVVDRVWSAIFYLFLAWLVYSWFGTIQFVLDTSTSYLKRAPIFRSIAESPEL